ncbi:MAG: ABC-F family ATP-binding cassette domain-containing protein, partial [Lachnospiraceae bacterium]|nr:ABC-F family ATP-binding cassette domain-containing protein [Lachnospiraceae bacterium]
HILVRYLPQSPQFDAAMPALQAVLRMAGDGVSEADAMEMLMRLGISRFDQPAGELSCGQRKRLALAAVLLGDCDVLVLDEPTNHLDSEMSSWLEERLRAFRGTLVMVTHDRYFLDSVCSRIVELDKGRLYSYETNYSGFLKLKAEREASAFASERKRQSILRKEIAWMQRGARARSTKQKAHIQRYEALRDQEAPELDAKVSMNSVYTRMGKTAVELLGISKSYGDQVLIRDFTYRFLKDDRIGFIGPNGCGKTTLMRMIAGLEQPDSGEIVIGQTIKIGYYSQEINDRQADGEADAARNGTDLSYMDPKMRVIDYIRNTAEYVRTEDGTVSASAMLELFLFPGEQQYSPLSKLSGGEKRRLNLLRVLMEAPNVLILDEPTNDLDITTLQILEDYLDSFRGIVITVSHDRYFLDRVVRRIFAFEEGGVLRQHEGGYTEYEARIREEREAAGLPANASGQKAAASPGGASGGRAADGASGGKADPNAGRGHEKKLKFSFKEQREYETIDDDIAALEAKLEELEQEMAANATNSAKLTELAAAQAETKDALDQKMERWMYLNELAEQIAAQG